MLLGTSVQISKKLTDKVALHLKRLWTTENYVNDLPHQVEKLKKKKK